MTHGYRERASGGSARRTRSLDGECAGGFQGRLRRLPLATSIRIHSGEIQNYTLNVTISACMICAKPLK